MNKYQLNPAGTIGTYRGDNGMTRITASLPMALLGKMLRTLEAADGVSGISLDIGEKGTLVTLEAQMPSAVLAKVLAKAKRKGVVVWQSSSTSATIRQTPRGDLTDPVVVLAAEWKALDRAYWIADETHNEPERRRIGEQREELENREHDVAPTSKAGAVQKMRNAAWWAGHDACIDSDADRLARSTIRLARKIERDEITSKVLRKMRALLRIAECYAVRSGPLRDYYGVQIASAIAHAIDWCSRPRLVG